MPVRALTRRSAAAATLPANVEVVIGDLTVPESLDAGLRGAGAVFLVWTAPPATAPAVIERWAADHAAAFTEGPGWIRSARRPRNG